MINFIIFENDTEEKSNYEMVILNFLGNRKERFKIIDYENYVQKTCNRNIYILSSSNLEECLSIAKDIRSSDDWNSQIIIISNIDIKRNDIFRNKLLVLDYINNDENLKDNLKSTVHIAYKILTKEKTLNFLLNGEIYRIPYRNILYIEKGNNQNHCTVYTIHNNEYIIKDTINNLEEKLNCAYFMKTHRSCIVNLYNITHYDCTDNIISFENKKIDLVAREKRQILKSKLTNEKIESKNL